MFFLRQPSILQFDSWRQEAESSLAKDRSKLWEGESNDRSWKGQDITGVPTVID